jgi:uncharacterized protein (UPF0147 family)
MKKDLEVLREAFDNLSNQHAKHIVRSAARSIVLDELNHDFPPVYTRQRAVKSKNNEEVTEVTECRPWNK